jgi:SET domain/MYND finger
MAVRRCQGCHKRAYCSEECQIADWETATKGGKGQGHREWCQLSCGEEGIAWSVSFISNTKGLGLVANRDFNPNERILVERLIPEAVFESRYPALPEFVQLEINNLEPKEGCLEAKLMLNQVEAANGGPPGLSIRLSRANHSCLPNSHHIFVSGLEVKVLVSNTHIKKGEEITISYVDLLDPTMYPLAPTLLERNWGIKCPKDCVCHEESFHSYLSRMRRLDSHVWKIGHAKKITKALELIKELLRMKERLHASACTTSRSLYDAFQLAVMSPDTLNEGLSFIQEAAALSVAAYGPYASSSIKFQEYAKNPSSHPTWMILEKEKTSENNL